MVSSVGDSVEATSLPHGQGCSGVIYSYLYWQRGHLTATHQGFGYR